MAPAQCTVCAEVFASKNKCAAHKRMTGHDAPTMFICIECKQNFKRLKELKSHRTSMGHMSLPLTTQPKHLLQDAPPPKPPTCVECEEVFETYHELSQHRRIAHGKEPAIALRCPRCTQSIAFGEVHTSCIADKRAACPMCRLSFASAAELQQHLEDTVTCEDCAVHLPPSVTLEDHWHVSRQHPSCVLCNKSFRDAQAWALHALECSFSVRGQHGVDHQWEYIVVEDASQKSLGINAGAGRALREVERAVPGAVDRAQWASSLLTAATTSSSEASSRRSSLVTTASGDYQTAATNSVRSPRPIVSPVTPDTAQDETIQLRYPPFLDPTYAREAPIPDGVAGDESEADIYDADVDKLLAREYGQHNIDRIASVLDECPAGAERKAPRSLLSLFGSSKTDNGPPSGYVPCGSSLATNSSSSAPAAGSPPPSCIPRALQVHEAGVRQPSPPLLGFRRGPSASVMPEASVVDDGLGKGRMVPSAEQAVDKVSSWLAQEAPSRAGQPSPWSGRSEYGDVVVVPEKPSVKPAEVQVANDMSIRCVSCLREPCAEPVATMCGHVFCQR
ncbi:hypothetical protein BD413DRAFT_497078 [Trametes elegans]|nr:hypothetical protein BD413DRAFT_497078 [Trametes elegans]